MWSLQKVNFFLSQHKWLVDPLSIIHVFVLNSLVLIEFNNANAEATLDVCFCFSWQFDATWPWRLHRKHLPLKEGWSDDLFVWEYCWFAEFLCAYLFFFCLWCKYNALSDEYSAGSLSPRRWPSSRSLTFKISIDGSLSRDSIAIMKFSYALGKLDSKIIAKSSSCNSMLQVVSSCLKSVTFLAGLVGWWIFSKLSQASADVLQFLIYLIYLRRFHTQKYCSKGFFVFRRP